MSKKILTLLVGLIFTQNIYTLSKKIVGLVMVHNEELTIESCLRGLAVYTDGIVVLDDNSNDNTFEIVSRLAKELNIEKIVVNTHSNFQNRGEWRNLQALLDAGRSIDGTHFIYIAADETFTANFKENDLLRSVIMSLRPGDSLEMLWIQLWKGLDQYRVANDYKFNNITCIFCDDKKCSYDKILLHCPRIPKNLNGKKYKLNDNNYGLLHFNFVNWRNILVKKAWYRCLELLTLPEKTIEQINFFYRTDCYALPTNSKKEKVVCKPANPSWFDYPFFNPEPYLKPVKWREQQVLDWFAQYGKDHFKDLEIWDIDWGTGLK